MIGKNPGTMKFFKILLPGFEKKLCFPAAFWAKISEEFSAEAVVTTLLGTWKIEVGKCSERFCFQGSYWDSFVKGHKLSVGDFIVFEHHGGMHFDASIFDLSACEKEFPVNSKVDIKDETTLQHGINSCPILTFKKYISAYSGCDYYVPRRSCLYIPFEFWKPNNLHRKGKAVLRIPGPDRMEWPVKLTFYKDRRGRMRYDRLAITKGWPEFCSANNIKKGDECTFEITDTAFGRPDNVVIFSVTIFSSN